MQVVVKFLARLKDRCACGLLGTPRQTIFPLPQIIAPLHVELNRIVRAVSLLVVGVAGPGVLLEPSCASQLANISPSLVFSGFPRLDQIFSTLPAHLLTRLT